MVQETGHLSLSDIISIHLVVYGALLGLLTRQGFIVRGFRYEQRLMRKESQAVRQMVQELWRAHFPTRAMPGGASHEPDTATTDGK